MISNEKIEELLKKLREELIEIETYQLFEHEEYKIIPKTKNSYRQDQCNTNTKTNKHSHVYAKPKGKGKQIYAVNSDGTGHDGSTNQRIPDSHADFFRKKGYNIDATNILESLRLEPKDYNNYTVLLLVD